MNQAQDQELAQVVEDAQRLEQALGENRISIAEGGPMLLGHLRRLLEIAPGNVTLLLDQRKWARSQAMHDFAANITPLDAWNDFKAGIDELEREFCLVPMSQLHDSAERAGAKLDRAAYGESQLDVGALKELARKVVSTTLQPKTDAGRWLLTSRRWREEWEYDGACGISTEAHWYEYNYHLRDDGEMTVECLQGFDSIYGTDPPRNLGESVLKPEGLLFFDFAPRRVDQTTGEKHITSDWDAYDQIVVPAKGLGITQMLLAMLAAQT